MRFSSYLGSDYLKAAEYGRDFRVMKIEDIREVESPFRDDNGKNRLAISLVDEETSEIMPVFYPNRTQLRSLLEIFGNDTKAAIGKLVSLGTTTVPFQGKIVSSFVIERHSPPLRAVQGGRRRDDLNDEDPF